MSRAYQGVVGPDGRSATPAGIVDTSAGADDVVVSEEVQRRLKLLFNEEIDTLKASYKLEVVFTEARSVHAPFGGIVSAWTNGGFAHGGGDQAVYFCPSPVEKNGQTRTCSTPLDLKWISKKMALCPVCRNSIEPKELAGQMFFKLTHQNWALVITRMFVALNNDADIRLVTMGGDLRRLTDAAIKGDKTARPEHFGQLRDDRHAVVYPLKNIVKDTSAGADLLGRIRAFLTA